MTHKIEYLITFKENDHFCNSVKTFKSLIEADSRINLKSNKLNYNEKDYSFKLSLGKTTENQRVFFQLELGCSIEDDFEGLRELSKIIRKLSAKANGEVTILWDDLGIHYSVLAYPIISKLENLLRKLITKFMLTNIGNEWTKETLPAEVKSAVDKNKRPNSNLLHQVDFIHLAEFLFKPYQSKLSSDLYSKLNNAKSLEDLNIEDLKNYVPRSNWERYFKRVVACEDEFLSKRWSKLYELRCLIAHNNFINKQDFDEINKISIEIEQPILQAIDKLDEIVIPEEEKEQIAESAIEGLDSLVGDFIKYWKTLEEQINKVFDKKLPEYKDQTIKLRRKIKLLVENNVLESVFLTEIDPLGRFRDQIISNFKGGIDKTELEKKNIEIEEFYKKRVFLEPPFFFDKSE